MNKNIKWESIVDKVVFNALEMECIRWHFQPNEMMLIFSYFQHYNLAWAASGVVFHGGTGGILVNKDFVEFFEEVLEVLQINFYTDAMLDRMAKMKKESNVSLPSN